MTLSAPAHALRVLPKAVLQGSVCMYVCAYACDINSKTTSMDYRVRKPRRSASDPTIMPWDLAEQVQREWQTRYN